MNLCQNRAGRFLPPRRRREKGEKEKNEKDHCCCLAFNTPRNTPANDILAAALFSAVLREKASCVVTQEDILIAHLPRGVEVRKVPDDERCPPPTLRIVRAAVGEAVRKGPAHIQVICAGPHWSRVRRDLVRTLEERAAAQVEILPPPKELLALPAARWFTGHSQQYHTAYRAVWYVREVLLWCLYHAAPKHLYGALVG